MHELTLNVIYTPRTVRYLSLLLWSMLEHSSCRFRLVANGCSAEEMGLLRWLSEQSPRLAFLALPTPSMMEHGEALNYLQARTEGDHFAFLDSDICAIAPLPSRIFEPIRRHTVCCCYPATLFKKGAKGWMQRNFAERTCTYLAVYGNDAVRKFRQSTGIGFDKYIWPEIPRRHRDYLHEMGFERPKYNTAQLLSLLILEPGEKPLVLRSRELVHIGGFSAYLSRDGHAPDARCVGSGIRQWAGRRLKTSIARLLPWTAESDMTRKRDISRYFAAFFAALFAGNGLPDRPDTGDAAIDRKVQLATQEIVTLFEKHGVHHVTAHSGLYQGSSSA